ncbi:MAG: phosphatase PAP2 family protein [Saprospiraceae bacterium]|nr:phosphatase PAP2 family protein [Saprospiraceae bacterium]
MVQGKWLDKINWRFNAADYATILYALTTAIWILIFFEKIENPLDKLLFRAGIIGFIVLLFNIRSAKFNDLIFFIKISYSSALLVYWYGETSALNTVLFAPFDQILYDADQLLFGYQPSIVFPDFFSQALISEIMHLGYFSYYVLNAIAILLYYLYDRPQTLKTVFIIVFSFFIYYWFFILFPSIGPQYFLPVELRNVPHGLVFQDGIRFLLHWGEKPTGAFPSSHVGMALIFMILIYRISKKSFWLLMPVTLILTFATVYLKAHYFIDVIGGIVSGIIIYWISIRIHHFISKKTLVQ